MSNFHLENFELAIKGLQSYIKKNQNDAEAYYMLASSYLGTEQNKEAANYYQKAIALDESRVNWMNELGILYYEMNDFKNAVIYFNKAKDKGFPQSASFIENLAYSYVYSGDFATGEKMLMDQWAKKPGNKDILRDLADAYYQRKLYDKSLEFCQKLLELDMKDAKAMYQAGMCFQKKGDKDRGQGLCDKAIELDPSLASMRKQQMMGAGL
jgi:Flp pilus assembly protein TadD